VCYSVPETYVSNERCGLFESTQKAYGGQTADTSFSDASDNADVQM
jgi:hypothetical protein